MKTDVEELSPTRVRLSVEVPFDELKTHLDKAYREIGRQVQIKGFRPGHVPRQILDQRIGRGAVLEQAINDAVPELYARAVQDADIFAVSQPEIEVTKLEDGDELDFTAEVDVRPSFEIPDLSSLSVVVEDAEVGPDQVEEYLGTLRERFASLRAADRPAQTGDYVSIDLSATADGKPVEDAQATGISYEVGSGSILDGLDDALAGMSAEETKTFQAELAGGEREGELADITVTVRSVKVKDLPALDDEFAQSASEFNTVGELRASTRKQLTTMRKANQVGQARDRALEALIDQIDMPLPESLVEHEIEHRKQSMTEEFDRAGIGMPDVLASRQMTEADLDAEIADGARRSIKAQFILDRIAENEKLGVEQNEIGEYITQMAYRQGVSPDAYARFLSEQNQIAAVVSDVVRSKAATLVAERAKVTDESGRKVTFGEPDDETGAETQEPEAEASAKGRGPRRGSAKSAAKGDAKSETKPAGRAGAKSKAKAAAAETEPDES